MTAHSAMTADSAEITGIGGGLETFEQYSPGRVQRGPAGVSAYLLPGFLNNMAAARIAIVHGIEGFSAVLSNSFAFGGHNTSLVFGPSTITRRCEPGLPADAGPPTAAVQ
ncbi:MAG TPA: hypothetical protein VGG25_14035 [Streptosporangiaceae bacterium]|jgi:3-oxoacyl-(acyl-carrier-protein) synthase